MVTFFNACAEWKRSGRYSSRTAFCRAMLEVEMRMGRDSSPLAIRKQLNTVPATR